MNSKVWDTVLDIESCTLNNQHGSVNLTAKDLMILLRLSSGKEKLEVISPQTLNQEVWKEEEYRGSKDSQKIRFYLFRLKKRVAENLHIEDIIYSVHGKGYKLNDKLRLRISLNASRILLR